MAFPKKRAAAVMLSGTMSIAMPSPVVAFPIIIPTTVSIKYSDKIALQVGLLGRRANALNCGSGDL